MTKLVRVVEHQDMSGGDISVLAQGGYLWLLVPEDDLILPASTPDLQWYRSLATGVEHLWYKHEIEEMPDAEG